MKKLIFFSFLNFAMQLQAQEMPKSSSTDRFSQYDLFKANRKLSSVSFSGGWGGLQGFVGGINARQLFAMPNGRLFLGVQGDFNASGPAFKTFSAGAVGRYYIFNNNRWSAFAQSSMNVGRSIYDNSAYQRKLIKYYENQGGFNPVFGGGGLGFNNIRATNNFLAMDAGIGLQYRITKHLALEGLMNKPIIFAQKMGPTPNSLIVKYPSFNIPQFKFGINYFFGK